MSKIPPTYEEFLHRREIPRSLPCPNLPPNDVTRITRMVFVSPTTLTRVGLCWVFGNRARDYDLIVEKFCDGWFPLILLSGGIGREYYESGKMKTLAAMGREELEFRGIPRDAILTEENAASTLEEVKFGRTVLISRGFMPASILYASAAHHMGRCLLTLRNYFPTARLLNMPFRTEHDGVEVKPETWHRYPAIRDRVYTEYVRIRTYAERGDIANPRFSDLAPLPTDLPSVDFFQKSKTVFSPHRTFRDYLFCR